MNLKAKTATAKIIAALLFIISSTVCAETNNITTTSRSTSTAKIKILPIKINTTGNSAADSVLQKFAAANQGNPAAAAALNSVAANIKGNPDQYINTDGSLNIEKIKNAVTQAFSNVNNIEVPSPDSMASEAKNLPGSVSSAGQR